MNDTKINCNFGYFVVCMFSNWWFTAEASGERLLWEENSCGRY